MFHKNTIFIVSKFFLEIMFKACVIVTNFNWSFPIDEEGLDLARYCIFFHDSHCCFWFACFFVKSIVSQLRLLKNLDVSEFLKKKCHSFHFIIYSDSIPTG